MTEDIRTVLVSLSTFQSFLKAVKISYSDKYVCYCNNIHGVFVSSNNARGS